MDLCCLIRPNWLRLFVLRCSCRILLPILVLYSCGTPIRVDVDSGSSAADAAVPVPVQHDVCADAGFQAALPTPLRTLYVDTNTGLDSNDGSAGAPLRTLNRANAAARPGDLFLVRGSFENQSIKPGVSGTPTAPIVFRGIDMPTLKNPASGVTVQLGGLSYVAVDGFEISDAKQPADLVNSQHCILRNNVIHDAGAIRVFHSSDNTLEDNRWPRCGTYCVILGGDSNRNRFDRNSFGTAPSFSIFFQGEPGAPSIDNVISHNTIENFQGGGILLSGSTAQTTLKCNRIQNCGSAVVGLSAPSITVASSDNVVFGNILLNNNGEPILLQSIGSNQANRNRIERNVAWGNAGPPLRFLISTPDTPLDNNLVQNNVLWASNLSDNFHWTEKGVRFKVVFDRYHTGTTGWPDGGLGGNAIRNNLIGRDIGDVGGGWLYFIGFNKTVTLTLSEAQARWSSLSGNFEMEPGFVAPASGDFRLGFDAAAGAAAVGRWLLGP